jgi:hypothetical protein
MSNCRADVEKITTIIGTSVITTYLDHRVDPSVIIDQATYDALDKVKCPETVTDNENQCIQPVGNTDAALVERGFQCVVKTITYDPADVATVAITSVTLHQADGTDVTATYEVTACPTPITSSVGSCVA